MKRWSAAELQPCPWNIAALGEEAVLADSERAGEVAAGVGRVRSLTFLNSLRVVQGSSASVSTLCFHES